MGAAVSSSQKLHPKTAAIFRFVVEYKRAHGGDSPSRRQIQTALDISSLSGVAYHLELLADAGLVTLSGHGMSRSIDVTGGRWVFEGDLIDGG